MKKNAVRLFALLMTALMLLPLCAGCTGAGSGNNENGTEKAAKIEYDLSGYRIIRPENTTQTVIEAAVSLRQSFVELFGNSVEIKDDWHMADDDSYLGAKEILVGKTNRPESDEALKSAKDRSCFVITVIGNKIVINAAADSGVASGIRFFQEILFPQIRDGKLPLPENYCYSSDPIPVLDVIAGGKCGYAVIYSDKLDNSKSAAFEGDGYDLEVDLACDIRNKLVSLTGIADYEVKIGTDWLKATEDPAARKEILVGKTSRAESEQFLASIGYDEYGFAVIGNKIVIGGHNLTTVDLAAKMFLSFLPTVVSGSAGDRSITLFSDVRMVKEYEGWLVDIPAYEGGKIDYTQDAGYQNLQIIVSETNENEFKAYRTKLEAGGYRLATENEITGNLFATYTGTQGMIHTYYVPAEKATHIVTCPDGKYELPANWTRESVPSYTKVTDNKITQMNLNYDAGNFGMCYIITLEDGSFIIFDGGGYNDRYGDDTRLMNLLKELNQRPDGKIVIAAWFLTHEHWDHFTNFQHFLSRFRSQVELEACYLNTCSRNEVYNSENPGYYVENDLPRFAGANGKPKVIKLHTGMKFYIHEAEFEVLYTQEDFYPKRCDFFNESSMITRMTLAGQSVLWFGDTRYFGSAVLIDRYGSYVKSDICQVAHHGYTGATVSAYTLIDPETLLWPTFILSQQEQTSGKTSSYFGVDVTIASALHVKSIIVAEPTQTITLPYKPGDVIVTNQN